jgi:hypothetical protein
VGATTAAELWVECFWFWLASPHVVLFFLAVGLGGARTSVPDALVMVVVEVFAL